MTNIPLFFEDHADLRSVILGDSNIHYILNVLRMKAGSEIWITNGKGEKALYFLRNVGKRYADLELKEIITEKRGDHKLHIAIAFTKNPARMEWFLEKATELGIETITPIITQRSEKIFFKRERFGKILVSAMLQSQQTFLPHLNDSISLSAFVEDKAGQKFIAYCGAEYERKNLANVLKPSHDTVFLIGPEGDFTEEEVHLCLQNNFAVVQLGKNRLRTETAGLYVCTLFNAIQ